MFESTKVIWKEGMFLQPQHFQQAERYLLDTFGTRLRIACPYSYGFIDVAVDGDALANGLFTLSRAAGVLPDGTVFDMPKKDRAAAPRAVVDHFTMERQSLEVHLALPLAIEGKANVVAAGTTEQTGVRYRSRTAQVTDDVLGAQKKDVEVGQPNLHFIFGDESLDNHSSVQVARLVRTASGQIVLDEAYVPPLLHVGASPALLNLLRGLLEILLAKIANLSQARRHVEGGSAQFTGAEETAYRLLQTLNTYTPLLNHHHFSPSIHPFDLFCYLTQFTGALCTFSSVVGIRNLPRYDHTDLGLVYATFSKVMRAVLEADISAGSMTLNLEQVRPATYLARVPDGRLFASSKFFLAVQAAVPEKELIVGVVQRMKVCSQPKLDLLISSAMPGVQLIHTSRPPENLSTKPGYHYFLLNQDGPLWKDIQDSGTVAMYFPNNFADLKMEIVALKQQ